MAVDAARLDQRRNIGGGERGRGEDANDENETAQHGRIRGCGPTQEGGKPVRAGGGASVYRVTTGAGQSRPAAGDLFSVSFLVPSQYEVSLATSLIAAGTLLVTA